MSAGQTATYRATHDGPLHAVVPVVGKVLTPEDEIPETLPMTACGLDVVLADVVDSLETCANCARSDVTRFRFAELLAALDA